MSIIIDDSVRQDVFYTKPSKAFPKHHQISPTIFLRVPNHQPCSDNQTHSNRKIIDIEDENTRKNGTSIDVSSDEEEIEVIQLSSDDDDEVNNEMKMKTQVKEDQTGKSVYRCQVLKTLGLTCRECSVLIETRSMLEQHMMKMHDKLPFKCMVRRCDRHFLKRSVLNKHYATHSTNQAKLICSEVDCQFETSILGSFWAHSYEYHEKGLFQCVECLKKFPLKGMVKRHFTKNHKHPQDRATKRFRCPFKACKYVGVLKSGLETHIPITIKEATQRNIQCDQDPRQFVGQIPYDLNEVIRQELNKPE